MSEDNSCQSSSRDMISPLATRRLPRRDPRLFNLASISLSLLSIALALSAAVIQFSPQITVTAEEPIANLQPFSSPFRIDNTGFASLWVEHVYCYAADVKWNFASMKRVLERSQDWEQFALERNESKTIVCNVLQAPTPPQEADIVIAIDYRLAPFLPWTFRKLTRFTGAYGDRWEWLSQPIAPIKSETNRTIDRLSDSGRSRYRFEIGGIQ